ncbi:MAG: hypothetical protein N2999_01755 [Proteobacteria bacterium]|nr:hypothetical protein [Pseudomonadota bacterium]
MYEKIDNSNIKTYSLYQRESKVNIKDFSKVGDIKSLDDFVSLIPHILAGKEIKEIARKVATVKEDKGKIILGMGAHLIKVGLSPIIIAMMREGIIDGIALNGACMIHDVEIAMVGHTSEDVAKEIKEGTFGMVKETTEFIINAVNKGKEKGLGELICDALFNSDFPYKEYSILSNACRYRIPVTIHLAIGTDIIHMHPSFDGATFGLATHRDFLVFSNLIKDLEDGVYINIGSAVILPEVFLKALSLVRNLGHPLKNITTINMDFKEHYRPLTNVVKRPTLEGGRGYNLIGHHEILLPLLYFLIKYYQGKNF